MILPTNTFVRYKECTLNEKTLYPLDTANRVGSIPALFLFSLESSITF